MIVTGRGRYRCPACDAPVRVTQDLSCRACGWDLDRDTDEQIAASMARWRAQSDIPIDDLRGDDLAYRIGFLDGQGGAS